MPTIVIATDGSAAALEAEAVGLDLAAVHGAGVVMLSVWAPLRGSFGLRVPEFLDREFIDAEREWAQETADAAAARAAERGTEVETCVRKGDVVAEVCRVVEEREAAFLVVGSAGWGAVMSLLLGRTTLGVLQHAPCPVVVVRHPASGPR